MATVRFGIDLVGVVVVTLANVATIWAQSDESPRRLRERVSRARVGAGFPSAAVAFDMEVKITASDASGSFGGSVRFGGDARQLW